MFVKHRNNEDNQNSSLKIDPKGNAYKENEIMILLNTYPLIRRYQLIIMIFRLIVVPLFKCIKCFLVNTTQYIEHGLNQD